MLPLPLLKLITFGPSNKFVRVLLERLAGVAAVGILALLKGYKILFSPLFAGSCRFYPSCSDYMAEAVRTHGPWRGVWLGCRRLLRCHPLGGHGVDPVPHS
jgi:putative membrane protein insertion efficiency factor